MPLSSTIAALAIVAANIMSNPQMPARDVRSDTARIFELRPTVVCANEIEPLSYKRSFRQLARAHDYTTRGLSSPNPVAVRLSSHWRAASVRVRLLSRGVDGITPDRFVTIVQLVRRESGAPAAVNLEPRRIVVLCAHLVSRAWTHVESSTELRQTLWRAAVRRLRAIAHRWLSRGAAVVVAGDMNHPRAVRFAARQRQLANAGLLQIAALPPAGVSVRRLQARTISARRLYTDHPIVERSAAFTR